MSLDFDSVTPSVPKWEADWNAAESRIKAHAATLGSLDKDSESDVRAWIVRWVSCVVSAVFGFCANEMTKIGTGSGEGSEGYCGNRGSRRRC